MPLICSLFPDHLLRAQSERIRDIYLCLTAAGLPFWAGPEHTEYEGRRLRIKSTVHFILCPAYVQYFLGVCFFYFYFIFHFFRFSLREFPGGFRRSLCDDLRQAGGLRAKRAFTLGGLNFLFLPHHAASRSSGRHRVMCVGVCVHLRVCERVCVRARSYISHSVVTRGREVGPGPGSVKGGSHFESCGGFWRWKWHSLHHLSKQENNLRA